MHPAGKIDNLQILLIEDNPGYCQLIQEIIHAENIGHWQLITADHLAQGLDKLAVGNIDLVLLDLSLPDSTGLNTLRRVLHQVRQVAIIVLTGSNDDEMAIQAFWNAVDDDAHAFSTLIMGMSSMP